LKLKITLLTSSSSVYKEKENLLRIGLLGNSSLCVKFYEQSMWYFSAFANG